MLIFIPMVGFGDRFIKAGFSEPKPLIPIDGKPMIERVVDTFREGRKDDKFLFCVDAELAEETHVRATLERIAPGAPVVVIEPHEDGPVRTLLDCADRIPDDEEIVIDDGDFGVDWSFPEFRAWLEKGRWDGAKTAYEGFRPHAVGPTNDKLSEYEPRGLYYFRSGAEMKRLARELVEKGERVNDEFYVSMLMQLLVERGGKVGVYPLRRFYPWGTPEDLRDFESWLRGIRRFRTFGSEATKTISEAVQVIPVAGRGPAVVDQGYTDPKPLVPVAGKAMIVRALECLPTPAARVLIVDQEHQTSEGFRETVASLGGRVVVVDKVTQGQASNARLGLQGIDEDTPVLFAPGDAGSVYDLEKLRKLESGGFDAIAWTTRSHLPALCRPQGYGWVHVSNGRVVKAAVKKQVNGVAPAEQEVLTGTFWFRDVATFLREEASLEAEDEDVNGELFVAMIVKRMVTRGARVAAFTVDKYIPWGTPEELRTFDYYSEVAERFS